MSLSKITFVFLPIVMMTLLYVCSTTSADIINTGFESGTGTDAASWNEIEVAGGAQGATATADRVQMMANTGAYSLLLDVVGAPDFGPVAEIQQQSAVGTVTGGTAYDFSFFAKGDLGPGAVAFYEVLWFDGDGSNGGGPQGSATGLQNFNANIGATYSQTFVGGLVAPASADSALVQIRLVTGAFDGARGTIYIDDATFTAVPEPTATVCLAICSLAGLRRRR